MSIKGRNEEKNENPFKTDDIFQNWQSGKGDNFGVLIQQLSYRKILVIFPWLLKCF